MFNQYQFPNQNSTHISFFTCQG